MPYPGLWRSLESVPLGKFWVVGAGDPQFWAAHPAHHQLPRWPGNPVIGDWNRGVLDSTVSRIKSARKYGSVVETYCLENSGLDCNLPGHTVVAPYISELLRPVTSAETPALGGP